MNKPFSIKKIIKIFGIVLLVFFMLLMLFTTLTVVIRDERQMSPWGVGVFVIASGSMEPEVPVGSVIVVTAVPVDTIKEKDVVSYLVGREVITHRVVGIAESDGELTFTTRGDNNNTDDPPVGQDRVIGRVVFTIPGNNLLIRMFQNSTYIGPLVISIGGALCIFGVISSIKKGKPSEKGNQSQEDEKTEEDTLPDDDIQDDIQLEDIIPDFGSKSDDNQRSEENAQPEDDIS